MKPLAPGRVRCCVPFCGRTFKIETPGEEVICGKHWRLADKRLRRLLTKIRRRFDRAPAERRDFLARMWWRVYDRCKAQAIERAMGA